MVQAANGAKAAPVRPEPGRLLRRRRRAPEEVRLPRRAPGGPEEDRAHRDADRRPRAARAWRRSSSALLILPLVLFLALLLGILVRSFPGPGDVEVVELSREHARAPGRRPPAQGWRRGLVRDTGLSLVADAKEAAATFTYQAPDARPHGRRHRHRRASTPPWPGCCPCPSTSCSRPSTSINDQGDQGREDLRPQPRLHGQEPRPQGGGAHPHLAGAARRRDQRHRLPAAPRPTSSPTRRCAGRSLDPRVQFIGYGRGGERKELKAGTAGAHRPVRVPRPGRRQGRPPGRAPRAPLRPHPLPPRPQDAGCPTASSRSSVSAAAASAWCR